MQTQMRLKTTKTRYRSVYTQCVCLGNVGIRDTIIVEIKNSGCQGRGLLTLSHRDLSRVVAVICVMMGYSRLGWIHITHAGLASCVPHVL